MFTTSGCRSRDLMSCDGASPNQVAEEVYLALWCWISFLLNESFTYITQLAFHNIYITVLRVTGGPTIIKVTFIIFY